MSSIELRLNRIENMLERISNQQRPAERKVRFLTVSETAELFSVHPATIYRYVLKGALPYRKTGNRYFFNEDKMLEILYKEEVTQG